MKVGFIGLGHMGIGMAANLLRAGHEVTVYNRTPGKAQGLVAQGARAAAGVADACGGDAVVTMLADDGAVEGAGFGEKSVIGSLGKGANHVSMSTISVALSERLTAAHANAGQRFVAAPVFGRPEMAAAAKLFIVAAGAPDAVVACRPLFEAMGQKTFPIGDQPKAANLVKLSGNFLSASVIPRPDEVVSRLLQRSHSYATDRLSLVLSGTWWVNSGADFDPEATVPVPAGGFVRRVARTPHYDGVQKSATAPTVIALFGIAPVELKLVDPSKPAWRRL